MLIGTDDGRLSTLCHSCGFCCQERMLKTFPSPGFLCFEDGASITVVFTGKFACLCLTISSGYGSVFSILVLIGRGGSCNIQSNAAYR